MSALGILGGGHFADLIIDLAGNCASYSKVLCFDDKMPADGRKFFGPISQVEQFLESGEIQDLSIAVGYRHFGLREQLFERYKSYANFPSFIHPSCFVSKRAEVGKGVCVFSMCNVETESLLEDNVTVFNQTSVTHGARICSGSFLSVKVALAGRVTVGKRVFIGVNATVVNDVVIGDDSVVCAGTLLTKSIPSSSCVIGNPFRLIDRIDFPTMGEELEQ